VCEFFEFLRFFTYLDDLTKIELFNDCDASALTYFGPHFSRSAPLEETDETDRQHDVLVDFYVNSKLSAGRYSSTGPSAILLGNSRRSRSSTRAGVDPDTAGVDFLTRRRA
jgi:hypothetical protein